MYDVTTHQQAATPGQLLVPFPDAEPDRLDDKPVLDLMAMRALKESRTDATALEFTDEQLRHLQAIFTKAADHARNRMDRYADRENATARRRVREDGQRARRSHPEPHRGPEAGR
ncbi:hypothetical protein Snoj_28050 [Streptomyces nojiriensis]|uniref:Uncharacterized protein n=1 Tax=Streptomyces nojiriensis TaxID=66374 RepID=A0ABQ3SLH5_9ACTN|nr:hypothetical protein [Streptomyces nojiriensis]QTI42487.1 hypothetical protein JYK04_00245 [Streptomyces nojiriensis]GGS39535.1 hypothetical protein GCM10010205_81520 [Streptomyces nojiriensis]GHI68887.1 hypothetical protein Snoj_28050 [Streptomyces nojiriensis]